MKLRFATAADIGAVVDLVTAMLQEMTSYGSHAVDEETRVRSLLESRFIDSLEKEDHVYIVAPLEEGLAELAGVVEASVVSPYGVFRPKSVLHVHSVYVQPPCRGEGIGRSLLEEALDWGRGRGCVEAELNVLTNNPARELYESLGFEVRELKMRLGL